MRKIFVSMLALLTGLNASAFSQKEHSEITMLAVKRLNDCIERGESPIRAALFEDSAEIMAKANAWEDTAVWKKWSIASHFYNPVKRLDWSKDEPGSRGDADDAVVRALTKFRKESRGTRLNPLKRVGQMLHYIQDASSPLHVIGVNHDLGDGFENNESVTAMREAQNSKISCARAASFKRDPLEILRSNATMTLKITDQEFNYRLGGEGRDRKARWSEVFYVNKALTSGKLSSLLKHFDPLGKMFNLAPREFPAGNMENLPRGGYGAFANFRKGIISSDDNFGQTDFQIVSQAGTRSVHIDRAEYVEFKKRLILEAVQASEETIVWSLMNQDLDAGS